VDFIKWSASWIRLLSTTQAACNFRLAFAVAAHLKPEILLIDEVLAVGDAAFQKCIGKMNEVSRSGANHLFVSHHMGAVTQLCNKGIFLDSGKLAQLGSIDSAIQAYMDQISDSSLVWSGEHTPTDFIRIRRIRLRHPEPEMPINTDMELIVDVEFSVLKPIDNISFEIWCRYEDGTLLFNSYTTLVSVDGSMRHATCKIPSRLLNEGFHSIDFSLSSSYLYALLRIDNALSSRVEKAVGPDDFHGKDPGVIRPWLGWEVGGRKVATELCLTS